MKVLFLDIDGVLNNSNTFQKKSDGGIIIPPSEDPLEPSCLKELDRIIDAVPEVKIVISSSWRIIRKLDQLKEIFQKANFKNYEKIIDVTPYMSMHRGYEIQAWLDKNPVELYAIVDDDNDMLLHQQHRFVKTWMKYGLQPTHADYLIDLLDGTITGSLPDGIYTRQYLHKFRPEGDGPRKCIRCDMEITGRGEPLVSCR